MPSDSLNQLQTQRYSSSSVALGWCRKSSASFCNCRPAFALCSSEGLASTLRSRQSATRSSSMASGMSSSIRLVPVMAQLVSPVHHVDTDGWVKRGTWGISRLRHVVDVLLRPNERRRIPWLDRLAMEQLVWDQSGNLITRIGGDGNSHHGSLIFNHGDAARDVRTVTRDAQTATISAARDWAAGSRQHVMAADEARDERIDRPFEHLTRRTGLADQT